MSPCSGVICLSFFDPPVDSAIKRTRRSCWVDAKLLAEIFEPLCWKFLDKPMKRKELLKGMVGKLAITRPQHAHLVRGSCDVPLRFANERMLNDLTVIAEARTGEVSKRGGRIREWRLFAIGWLENVNLVRRLCLDLGRVNLWAVHCWIVGCAVSWSTPPWGRRLLE